MKDANGTPVDLGRYGLVNDGRRPSLGWVLAAAALGCVTTWTAEARADDRAHYWVYFADKGFDDDIVAKTEALRHVDLAPRALERRARVRGSAVVDERDLPVAEDYVDAVLDTGAKLRVRSRWFNAISVAADDGQLATIRSLPAVVSIEPVRKASRPAPVFTQDPVTSAPGGVSAFDYGEAAAQLELMNVPAAHECGLTGTGVVVGILDTGFQTAHETFAELDVIATYDFINGDETVSDEAADDPGQHGHGTSVLSLIAGNSPGVHMGVAPNVSVLLAKTESVPDEIEMEEDWYVAGLEWVESMGADLVTTSLGYLDWYTYDDFDGQTAVTTQAVNMAVANGLIALTAMGNLGPDPGSLIAPADSEVVLSLGATDLSGALVGFSSRGPTADGRIKPNFVAPGAQVHLANAGGGFSRSSGTSFSTPLTAGGVALIVEANPDITPAELRALLEETAVTDVEPNNDTGWGLVDIGAAVADACNCADGDGDGFRDASCGGDDCNDADPNIHPDATEVCDGVDNDCNDEIDEVDCGGSDGDSGGSGTGPDLTGGLSTTTDGTPQDDGEKGCACGVGSTGLQTSFLLLTPLVMTARRRRIRSLGRR